MGTAKDVFVEAPDNTTVFKQGESGSEVYIIESGHVDLVHHTRAGDTTLTLGAGDFFGEAALLDNQAHAVTALAKAKSRLLRIERAAFPDVLRQNVEIGVCLMRKLVARQHAVLTALDKLNSNAAIAPAPLAAAVAAPASKPVADAVKPAARTPERAAAKPAAGLAFRVTAANRVIALDPARSDFLIGRPDAATGVTPEVDLGPFDVARTLSRRHARIVRDGHGYLLREDTATTNGTFVNGERLQAGTGVALKPGDKLRFGSIEVEVIAA